MTDKIQPGQVGLGGQADPKTMNTENPEDMGKDGMSGHKTGSDALRGETFTVIGYTDHRGREIVEVGGVKMPRAQAEQLGATEAAPQAPAQGDQTQQQETPQAVDGFDPSSFTFDGVTYDLTDDAQSADMAAALEEINELGLELVASATADELRAADLDPDVIKKALDYGDAVVAAQLQANGLTMDDLATYVKSSPATQTAFRQAFQAFMSGDGRPAQTFAQAMQRDLKGRK